MPTEFKLMTKPLPSKSKSALHHVLLCLIHEKSQLIQDWNITRSIKEDRDVFYIALPPAQETVLTRLPAKTKVTCHLSIEAEFRVSGPLEQRRNESICHYTEQYEFPIDDLWSGYQRVTIHVYANRKGEIIDEPTLKGFKPGIVGGEYINFSSPVLKDKIGKRALVNANPIRSYLRIINAEKFRRYEEVLTSLMALEEKLKTAYQRGKNSHQYQTYLKLAPDYIKAIENLNQLNDQAHDPRGELTAQFCDLLMKARRHHTGASNEAPAEEMLEETRALQDNQPCPVKLKEAETKRLEAERAMLRSEYQSLSTQLEPQIEAATQLVNKIATISIEQSIALSRLKSELEIKSMELCVFMERKNTSHLGKTLHQTLDNLLEKIETHLSLDKLFAKAIEDCNLNTVTLLYPNMDDYKACGILIQHLLSQSQNARSNLYLKTQQYIAMFDFLLTQSLSLEVFVKAKAQLAIYNENTSTGATILAYLLLLDNFKLFQYLLSKGMDANGTGIISGKNLYSLLHLAIAFNKPQMYFEALFENGANFHDSNNRLCEKDSIESKIALRKFGAQGRQAIPNDRREQSKLSLLEQSLNIFEIFTAERTRANSLLKIVIYCTQNPRLAGFFIHKMNDNQLAELSCAELLLVLAILNLSSEVISRFLPSSLSTTLALLSDRDAAKMLTDNLVTPHATGQVAYLFFPANPSSPNTNLYFAAYKRIETALLQYLKPGEIHAQNKARSFLSSLADTHADKRPHLAVSALLASTYLKILTYNGTPNFFKGLDGVFDKLHSITSKPPYPPNLAASKAYLAFAEHLRMLFQQSEVRPVGERYRFHQEQAAATPKVAPSQVEELADDAPTEAPKKGGQSVFTHPAV